MATEVYVAISSTDRTGDTVVDGGGATYSASFTDVDTCFADATYGYVDLSAATGNDWIIHYQLFKDGSPYPTTSGIVLSNTNYTSDAANYAIFEAAAGEGHGGIKNNGCIITSTALVTNISASDFCVVRGIESQHPAADNKAAVHIGTNGIAKSVIGKNGGTITQAIQVTGASITTSGIAYSCLVYDSAVGFGNPNSTNARFYNCVALNCTSSGFGLQKYSNVHLYNCLGVDNVLDYKIVNTPAASVTGYNNASSDLTAFGTNPVTNIIGADELEDVAASNPHLTAGATSLVGQGYDVSGFGVDIDIDGQPWSAFSDPVTYSYSIGCDQEGQFTVPCIFNGVPVNTEIRIYKDSDKSELIGVELSTADPEQLDMPYSAPESAYAVLINPSYKYFRQENLTIAGSGIDLPLTIRSDRDYSVTSGITGITFNTTTKKVAVTSTNDFQDLYSYTMEQWKSDANLPPHDFPFDAISAEAGIYEFIDGWDFDADTSRHNTRGGAWDTATAKWMNVKTLGSATGQPYYTQGGLPADTERTDIQDTVIDITSNQTDFKLFLREQGKTFDEYDLITEQSITNLVAKTYFVPLANETDSKISASDATIAANTPYTSMTLTYLDGAGFTTYADATIYPVNSVVTDGTRWFITALGGTSNGATLGVDTGVTDWIAYSGERDIDGTYYPFNTIFDGASGSKVQIYEKHQHMMRQDTDIATGVRGDTADLLMYFLGDVLYTNQGCYIDGFQAGEQLDYRFTDSTGAVQQLPAPTVSLTINSNVSADIKIFDTGTQTVVSQATGTTANTEVLGTYDITVMAQGYLPQRQTGKTLGSTIVTIDFELISDPIYNDSHTLAYPTHLTYNRTLKELTLLDRRAGRDIYSALIDAFIDQSTLDNTPFDFQAVGIDSIFFLEDAELATGSEDNWYDAGIRYINSSDVVTAEWCSIKSSGAIPSGVTGRYQTGQGTGTTPLRVSGAVNQIIQIYKTGNFDYRNYLVIKFQANPYIDTRSDILALAGVSTLEPFEYSVAIEPTTLDITVGTGGATLTLVDHTATPKVVGGKSFSYEIIDTGTATAEDILRTWDYNIAQAPDYLTYPSFNLPEFIAQSGTTYETRQGIVESEGDTLYGCYVSRSGGDHPDFTRHQSDDGTYYVAPVQVTIAAPNLTTGTFVIVENLTDGGYIDNGTTLLSDGYSTSINYTSDKTVRILAAHPDNILIDEELIVTSGGATLTKTQETDTVYVNNGIDGSLVVGFTPDYVEDDVNIQVAGTFSILDGYAWYKYILMSEQGLKDFAGAMVAVDAATYQFDTDKVAGMYLDNNGSIDVAESSGATITRKDGLRPTKVPSTGGYGIHMNWGKVYVATTGSGPLTASQESQLASAASNTAQLTYTNTNELDVNVKSNNDSPVYGSGTSTDKWRGEL